jgi:hypothetical protein
VSFQLLVTFLMWLLFTQLCVLGALELAAWRRKNRLAVAAAGARHRDDALTATRRMLAA